MRGRITINARAHIFRLENAAFEGTEALRRLVEKRFFF
jgi:hypothetical protein